MCSSLLALAIATPALAQDKATEGPSVLDELVPEGSPDAAVPPAPTGDPVLDRLNALEFKVRALETRNVELETALDTANGRVETVTSKANKGLASNRSEEHTSELQSLMRITYAVFCLKKKSQVASNYHGTAREPSLAYTVRTHNYHQH